MTSRSLEVGDWVFHKKKQVVGKIISIEKDSKTYWIYLAEKLPNQTWDFDDVELYQKKGTL